MAAVGINPVAHSRQDWIDGTLFEIVVYGMDVDLCRDAFIDMDIGALESDGMVVAFEQMRKLTDWSARGSAGREWDGVRPLFSSGESGFLFTGDWAIDTFIASGLEPGIDYVCAGAPKDWNDAGFILNSDSVILFEQRDADYRAGQKLLAELIMSADFQAIFNQAKGSIPTRLDVDLSEGCNPCQQKAQADLQAAIENDTLLRSMAHDMSVPQRFRGVMLEVITEFVNTPGMSAEEAAKNLALAVEDQL